MTNNDWRHQAACREEDGELFFPAGYIGAGALQAEDARRVCQRCPVMDACYRWALDTRQGDGVWGASTPDERRSHLRRIERNRAKNRQEAAS